MPPLRSLLLHRKLLQRRSLLSSGNFLSDMEVAYVYCKDNHPQIPALPGGV